jgi:uncharacterized membrane protein
MGHMLGRFAAILFLSSALVPAIAQSANHSAGRVNTAHPPDLVCWGSGPDWSMEFASWGARYLGVNQPDQDFSGSFSWVQPDRDWVWQRRTADLAPMIRPSLSAVVKESACVDPANKKTYRYSAQVSLPQGDSVSGCCRRLKPGEAPIGPQGVPPSAAPSNVAPSDNSPKQ